jgi:hypothetical protein
VIVGWIKLKFQLDLIEGNVDGTIKILIFYLSLVKASVIVGWFLNNFGLNKKFHLDFIDEYNDEKIKKINI